MLLRAKGYDVDYILLGIIDPSMENFLKEKNFKYVTIKIKNFLSYPRSIFKIVRRLRKYRPAIIHTHLVTANLLGLVAGKLTGIKTRVFTQHSGKRQKGEIKTKV